MVNNESAVQLLTLDPVETAEMARLRYVDEKTPGLERKRRGRGFIYLGPSGERLTDRRLIERIRSLAIPPAWQEVWICLSANGHIQATGRDARGRKQYIYHPRWQELRNQNKFDRLLHFGRLLPGMRERVESDLSKIGMSKERALAFVVRLLDITLLRIGNPEYVRRNNSYGLTTLLDDHVEICGTRMHFSFPGKGQKHQKVEVRDRRLANLAKKYQELPGQELIRYVNGDGNYATVDSGDVNAYLMEISTENFTAKDFRTWGASVLTAAELLQIGPSGTKKGDLRNVTRAIRKTALRLGNTLSICRKYYVHPAVINSYLCGELCTVGQQTEWPENDGLDGLAQDEKFLMLLLQKASTRSN